MLDKAYDAKQFENEIYRLWESSGSFRPNIDPDNKPFVISMPPPNATGTLHLGHAVMLAIEDIMVRYHRMKGIPALYLPGTDHAAIATQSKVESILAEQGKKRTDLGREAFLEKVKEFVADSQETIRNQIRKMGTSCDWSREKYTLEGSLNRAVNEFFRRMYDDGLIYRGDRIVNWDPKMQTTVADDEIEHEEQEGILYHIQYGPLVVATSRPETKLGDTAVAVNPKDKKWKQYIGQTITVDFPGGHTIEVPVIADQSVDPTFGSGALGVTPAHSAVDFDLAVKHGISKPQVIDFHGKMTDVAGPYVGLDLFDCRKKLVADLEAEGKIVKKEPYRQAVARNYRGGGIIEPQIMKQWFVDVNKQSIDWKGKKLSLKEVMLDTVKSQMIQIIPDRFEKTYFHWIENLRDWCISRQIWWGHRIPIWYEISAEDFDTWNQQSEKSSFLFQILNIQPKQMVFSECEPSLSGGNHWIQDPDTLDTWFSSALWTFSTLGWPDKTDDLKYFHPTSVLETGYDILFFWVARMILASTYCLRSDGLPEEQCIPFRHVYLHGLVRDRNGAKMSKSKPETCIDPLDMIEKYGTDALRLSLFIGSTPGNDTRLYEEKIAGYRNFVNKLWNVARFALMNIDFTQLTAEQKFQPPTSKTLADEWILSRLADIVQSTAQRIEKFHFSEAAEELYAFTWSELADWYLEIAKIEGDKDHMLFFILKNLLTAWHPFVPFVTEVIWKELLMDELLITSPWPTFEKSSVDKKKEQTFSTIKDVISTIRNLRAEANIEPSRLVNVIIIAGKQTKLLTDNQEIISRLARVEHLGVVTTAKEKPNQSLSQFLGDLEIYIPLEGLIDTAKERLRLEKEIREIEKYIAVLQSKLSNKGFADNAPKQILELEQQKLAQAEEKLRKLTEQLTSLE